MGLTQRFALIKPDPLLPPEWGCAECRATMSEDPQPSGEYPAESVIMAHSDDCRYSLQVADRPA